MIRFLSTILFLVILSLNFSSCNYISNFSEIKRIDSLEQVLNNVLIKADRDQTPYINMRNTAEKNMDSLQRILNFDSLDYTTSMLINSYKTSERAAKTYLNSIEYINAEVSSLKGQLKNLKKDIRNGHVKDKKIDNYFSVESLNVAKIDIYTDGILTTLDYQYSIFDSLNTEVESIFKSKSLSQE